MPKTPIRGFPAQQWAAEHDLEEKAEAIPRPENIRDYIERMSAQPHEAGSPRSEKVARELLGLMRSWGLDARIEEFEALMPTPKCACSKCALALRAKLREPAVPGIPIQPSRITSHLQRLFGLRRCDRPAGLRQLRLLGRLCF